MPHPTKFFHDGDILNPAPNRPVSVLFILHLLLISVSFASDLYLSRESLFSDVYFSLTSDLWSLLFISFPFDHCSPSVNLLK